jgi:hypothetical protein
VSQKPIMRYSYPQLDPLSVGCSGNCSSILPIACGWCGWLMSCLLLSSLLLLTATGLSLLSRESGDSWLLVEFQALDTLTGTSCVTCCCNKQAVALSFVGLINTQNSTQDQCLFIPQRCFHSWTASSARLK